MRPYQMAIPRQVFRRRCCVLLWRRVVGHEISFGLKNLEQLLAPSSRRTAQIPSLGSSGCQRESLVFVWGRILTHGSVKEQKNNLESLAENEDVTEMRFDRSIAIGKFPRCFQHDMFRFLFELFSIGEPTKPPRRQPITINI